MWAEGWDKRNMSAATDNRNVCPLSLSLSPFSLRLCPLSLPSPPCVPDRVWCETRIVASWHTEGVLMLVAAVHSKVIWHPKAMLCAIAHSLRQACWRRCLAKGPLLSPPYQSETGCQVLPRRGWLNCFCHGRASSSFFSLSFLIPGMGKWSCYLHV